VVGENNKNRSDSIIVKDLRGAVWKILALSACEKNSRIEKSSPPEDFGDCAPTAQQQPINNTTDL
jgi:hypothetical protein